MISGPDPIGRDLARARAARRLPPDNPACVVCGEHDPEVLGQRPAGILEEHHVAGHVNDSQLTVTLCLNCHRRASARMPAYGIKLDRDAVLNRSERLVGQLRGLAVLHELLSASLMAWSIDLDRSLRESRSDDGA